MRTMTTLIERLLALPALLRQAEGETLSEQCGLLRAEENLASARASILLARKEDGTPELDGKNEAQREAQIHFLTGPERESVAQHRYRLEAQKVHLRGLQTEFAALRAAARLVAAGTDFEFAGELDRAA